MAKRGRPSGHTKEIADTITQRLEQGETLRAICRDDSMPTRSMFYRWMDTNSKLRDQYDRAVEIQMDAWSEEIIEIADGEGVSDDVARDRLRVDTRKWLMARIAAKRWGDKKQVDANVNHSGAVNHSTIDMVRADLNAIVAKRREITRREGTAN